MGSGACAHAARGHLGPGLRPSSSLIQMSCNSHRHSGLTLGSGQDNSVLGGEKCVQGVTMCGRGIGFHSCACVCVCVPYLRP